MEKKQGASPLAAGLQREAGFIRPVTDLRCGVPSKSKAVTGGALLTGVSALMISSAAFAQVDTSGAITLDKLQVRDRTSDTNPYSEDGAPYKAKKSGDRRRVKDLADTPATIDVRTQTANEEAGRTDLRDVLLTVPGVTLGTGENGNAFGDRYIIRGHEARSDVFVDSLRDPGMTTRESFATEQVEVTKGPSGTFAGRGSTGGAVNSVTKQASSEYDFTRMQAGLGTDSYRRLTLDTNKKINDDIAVRVNLLHAYRDVPDRAPADKERNGIAVAGSYTPGNGLSVLADLYYLEAEDKPDLGSYIRPNGGGPLDDIASYVQDEDFLESKVAVGTVRVGYDFSNGVRLENALRYGTTDNGYVATSARGTDRDASDPDAPGVPTIGLGSHQRRLTTDTPVPVGLTHTAGSATIAMWSRTGDSLRSSRIAAELSVRRAPRPRPPGTRRSPRRCRG